MAKITTNANAKQSICKHCADYYCCHGNCKDLYEFLAEIKAKEEKKRK